VASGEKAHIQDVVGVQAGARRDCAFTRWPGSPTSTACLGGMAKRRFRRALRAVPPRSILTVPRWGPSLKIVSRSSASHDSATGQGADGDRGSVVCRPQGWAFMPSPPQAWVRPAYGSCIRTGSPTRRANRRSPVILTCLAAARPKGGRGRDSTRLCSSASQLRTKQEDQAEQKTEPHDQHVFEWETRARHLLSLAVARRKRHRTGVRS
jgi:hypothetical protein